MKIIIFTDSLGYLRGKFKKNIYTALLKKNLKKENLIIIKDMPGATILRIFDELKKEIKYSKDFKIKPTKDYLFDAIIIQCGIVDCSPRPFNRVLTLIMFRIEMILRLSIFSKLHKKLSKSNFFLSNFGRPWVSEKVFYNTLVKIQSLTDIVAKKTIYLEIAKPAHNLIKNCGDFSKTVNKYNYILKSIRGRSVFLKLFHNKSVNFERYLLQDGHHLNLKGHKLYYSKIKSVLKF
jgi:hypothetical protein